MALTIGICKVNFLQIMVLLTVLPYGFTAYPIFGTKRYGRSTTPVQNGWGMSSVIHMPSYYYQALPRPQTHYPISYYEALNPYAPDYLDDYYYPQEAINYPLYYPSITRSNSKYDMYQPAVPYYYGERHFVRPNYGYYDGSDPVDDIQEEILQEEEREEREEALPIGQETWYETDGNSDSDESMDDVNAAFLQNLMMYNDAMSNQNYAYGKVQPVDSYMQQYNGYAGDYDQWNTDSFNQNYNMDDEEEKELKMLAENPKKQKTPNYKKHDTPKERMQMFESGNKNQRVKNYDPNNSEAWLNYNNKRTKYTMSSKANDAVSKKQQRNQYGVTHFETDLSFNPRKQQSGIISHPVSTSTPVPTSFTTTSIDKAPRDAQGGQKEVVMMRPATPVRRPFSEPVMKLLAQQGGPERKRTPSVYDTIKHMLEMEKSLEKEYKGREHLRPPMRKRYVSSEESLVEELSGLKKTA